MNKQPFTIFAVLCVMLFGTACTPAQAATLSESLSRMDVIIREMQALRAEFAMLAVGATPLAPAASVLGASTKSVLTDDLSYGATNASIEKIQKLLSTDTEIYGDANVSGFFGPKTQDAIRRFQSRFGLDTVGIVGPSTKAILEAFMAAYPDGNYPAGVLKGAVPKVLGVSTSAVSPLPAQPASPLTSVSTPTAVSKVSAITFDEDDGEVVVHSRNTDGTRNRDLILYPEDEAELIELVAKSLKITEAAVRTVADLDSVRLDGGNDEEETDAEDAIDEAKERIRDAKDEIDAAADDGEDTDDAEDILDEAREALADAKDSFEEEEYEDALDSAEEAIDLARDAKDEL